MTPGSQYRDLTASEYLDSLRAMTQELNRAMNAIARNNLAGLEESIDNQQVLSARLARLANLLSLPLESLSGVARPSMDAELLQQIHSADNTLQTLNRQYAALLQHSSRSIALMASLFSSFQGQIQEGSGSRSKQQTWSCQV
jgi:hypothetical protein